MKLLERVKNQFKKEIKNYKFVVVSDEVPLRLLTFRNKNDVSIAINIVTWPYNLVVTSYKGTLCFSTKEIDPLSFFRADIFSSELINPKGWAGNLPSTMNTGLEDDYLWNLFAIARTIQLYDAGRGKN